MINDFIDKKLIANNDTMLMEKVEYYHNQLDQIKDLKIEDSKSKNEICCSLIEIYEQIKKNINKKLKKIEPSLNFLFYNIAS